jgi:hypothetical protein
MVRGLLMELDDHNCWTIAEAVGHRGPHRLQHLLSRAVWDDQQVLDIASAWAAGHLLRPPLAVARGNPAAGLPRRSHRRSRPERRPHRHQACSASRHSSGNP